MCPLRRPSKGCLAVPMGSFACPVPMVKHMVKVVVSGPIAVAGTRIILI